jgi:hypothetical protein
VKLKRYCVTINDNWTPIHTFWTLEGAKKFYRPLRQYANVFKWDGYEWSWMCGARDLHPDPAALEQSKEK